MRDEASVEGIYIAALNSPDFVWANIPPFAIITGINGVGKSRTLKALQQAVKAELKDNIVCVDDYYRFDQSSSSGHGHTDLDYELKDRATLFKTVGEIRRNIDAGVSFIDSSDYVQSCVSTLLTRIQKGTLKQEEITDNLVIEAVLSHVQYEKNLKNSLKQPLAILAQVFSDYYKRVKHNRAEINSNLHVYMTALFVFHNERTQEAQLSHQDFMSRIRDGVFFDELVRKYQEKIFDNSPLDVVNKILHDFGFKYYISFDAQDNTIKMMKGPLELKVNDLSSGERLILAMMSWLFYTNGMGEKETIPARVSGKGIKVLLLDEPDKHLDPNLCKLFFDIAYEVFVKKHHIQVIMSSHRVDTVSLAPPESIFVMQQGDEHAIVQRVHKLRALMRMTTNVREIVEYEHKVYAESTNDMLFYQGVYSSLKRFCDETRQRHKLENLPKPARHAWQLPNESFRLLSRRYRINFYTVSKKEKADGGCGEVIRKIQGDMNAVMSLDAGTSDYRSRPNVSTRWKQQKHILNSTRFFQSFGFVDNDYGNNAKLPVDMESKIVVMPDRHSLENYILDPIILCSVLTEQEIDALIEGSELRQSRGATVSNFEAKKNTLRATCHQIKQLLHNRHYDLLQNQIDDYFLIMIETLVVVYSRMPNSVKPESRACLEALKRTMQSVTPQQLFNASVKILNTNTHEVFELDYPPQFLELRGHDIEDLFLGKKNRLDATNKVCERVFDSGIEFIPLDLAKMFFELNDKVRANVLPAFN